MKNILVILLVLGCSSSSAKLSPPSTGPDAGDDAGGVSAKKGWLAVEADAEIAGPDATPVAPDVGRDQGGPDNSPADTKASPDASWWAEAGRETSSPDTAGAEASPEVQAADTQATTACNVVANTGCQPGQKCGFAIDIISLKEVSLCVSYGLGGELAKCTMQTSGADDCKPGFTCMAKQCHRLCTPGVDDCGGDGCNTYSRPLGIGYCM